MNTFFMVYAEGKETPAVKHEDYNTALKEAQRLSDKLGVPCYVLESEPYYVKPRQKEVEKIPPKPVYWFAATKNVEKNKALLAKMEELTGLKAEEDILDDIEKEHSTSPFIYNSRRSIIRYHMDNSAEFEACYLFGTELRIKWK